MFSVHFFIVKTKNKQSTLAKAFETNHVVVTF